MAAGGSVGGEPGGGGEPGRGRAKAWRVTDRQRGLGLAGLSGTPAVRARSWGVNCHRRQEAGPSQRGTLGCAWTGSCAGAEVKGAPRGEEGV